MTMRSWLVQTRKHRRIEAGAAQWMGVADMVWRTGVVGRRLAAATGWWVGLRNRTHIYSPTFTAV